MYPGKKYFYYRRVVMHGGNLCTSSGYPEDTAAMVEYSIQACADTLRYTQGSRQQRKVKDESKH